MDIGLLFTIVGTLFTLLFGIFAVYTFYVRKYPGEVSCFYEEYINLHNSIIKNINHLKVLYKNETINENMYLIKGVVLNSGNKDLTASDIEKSLKLSLPENGKWLDSKVINKSTDLVANLSEDGNKLEFDLGLFRKGEYVYFEALAESETIDTPHKNLKFEHRIADTDRIKIYPKQNINEQLKTKLFMLGTILMGLIMSSYLTIDTKSRIYNFRISSFNSKKDTVNLFPIYLNQDSTAFINMGDSSKAEFYLNDSLVPIDSLVIASIYQENLWQNRRQAHDKINYDSLERQIEKEIGIFSLLNKFEPKEFKEESVTIEFIPDNSLIWLSRISLGMLLIFVFALAKYSFEYYILRKRNMLFNEIKTAANIA